MPCPRLATGTLFLLGAVVTFYLLLRCRVIVVLRIYECGLVLEQGTSADQDTRFSNKMKKLLKSQKFAPELDVTVSANCGRAYST